MDIIYRQKQVCRKDDALAAAGNLNWCFELIAFRTLQGNPSIPHQSIPAQQTFSFPTNAVCRKFTLVTKSAFDQLTLAFNSCFAIQKLRHIA